MRRTSISRRSAMAAAASLVTGSQALRGQTARAPQLAGEPPGRVPPADELINMSEFEAVARRKLDSLTFAKIASGDRASLDRITLRPRLMVDTTKMDLTTHLFGQELFMPIIAGPISRQKRFHPDGELAIARGISAAKSLMVISDDSSYPVDQIAAQAKCPLWYQVWLEPDLNELRGRVDKAIGAGCKVLCITVGDARADRQDPAIAGVNWGAIDRLRKGLRAPVLLKGIMSPAEAQKAVSAGIEGIVVSNYSERPVPGAASSIEVLPSIADAVAGKAAILIDGGFQLGSDVFKALALGAQAVMLARPVAWGLAAYGEQGVQHVMELIQSEFARDMAMCGKVDVKALDRTAVKVHMR